MKKSQNLDTRITVFHDVKVVAPLKREAGAPPARGKRVFHDVKVVAPLKPLLG